MKQTIEGSTFKSAIYTGWVRHRRAVPRAHEFSYRVFMMYLDLDELDAVCACSPFWSAARRAPVRFKREDYFGDPSIPLATAVRERVSQQLGIDTSGPVRMLTNLRHFGFIMNPLTVYYCFDRNEKIQAMLLEITNTPWGERHQYVFNCDPGARLQRINFTKVFHVSPYMPMNMIYQWRSNTPESTLVIHMVSQLIEGEHQDRVFDATLSLRRSEIGATQLNGILLRYPFITLKVFVGIYWQALKLLVKKTPFYRHPETATLENKRCGDTHAGHSKVLTKR
ncbi:MAG: DUF1365 domain-containing protein [Exilibacterium sp.]